MAKRESHTPRSRPFGSLQARCPESGPSEAETGRRSSQLNKDLQALWLGNFVAQITPLG
jgi:hypothetical protein